MADQVGWRQACFNHAILCLEMLQASLDTMISTGVSKDILKMSISSSYSLPGMDVFSHDCGVLSFAVAEIKGSKVQYNNATTGKLSGNLYIYIGHNLVD